MKKVEKKPTLFKRIFNGRISDWVLRVWDSSRIWIKIFFIAIGVIIAGFIVLLFFVWLFFGRTPLTQPEDINWGVTYSSLAAQELGLDPHKTYEEIINDLKPNRLRLIAYWNRIEANEGTYDYSELDFQTKLAEDAGIPYIIVVGQRVPRYPECHIPGWANEMQKPDRDQKLVDFVSTTIKRYDANENQIAWQIENEAFVGSFGICPEFDKNLLNQEISTARGLTKKPIMLTESGELSLWLKASKNADILGTTLYRTVIVGKSSIVVQHIFPPWYYRARSNIIQKFRTDLEKVIVAELQGEPWSTKPILESSDEELNRTMNKTQFERNIGFTEEVGFPEVYFWGVEWWYYQKEKGNPHYWERSKLLFGTAAKNQKIERDKLLETDE